MPGELQDTEATDVRIGCWFTDLPAAALEPGAEIVFTFGSIDTCEGKNFPCHHRGVMNARKK
jgi:hypothetical protein